MHCDSTKLQMENSSKWGIDRPAVHCGECHVLSLKCRATEEKYLRERLFYVLFCVDGKGGSFVFRYFTYWNNSSGFLFYLTKKTTVCSAHMH